MFALSAVRLHLPVICVARHVRPWCVHVLHTYWEYIFSLTRGWSCSSLISIQLSGRDTLSS